MLSTALPRQTLVTPDQVALSYIDLGQGEPLVLLPGWSQTAALFQAQIEAFSQSRRVIALDWRGHGLSAKPSWGYRVPRFAQDLRTVLTTLLLPPVVALGHSLGCSVLWNYWDLFGGDCLKGLILVDQPPCLLANPQWSEETAQRLGATVTLESLFAIVNGLTGEDSTQFTAAMLETMLSPHCPQAIKDWLLTENLQFPRDAATSLILNNMTQDWRDTMPRINVPTLIISGRSEVVTWQSQVWIQEQVAGSRLEFVTAESGGTHFPFTENSSRFNQVVLDFFKPFVAVQYQENPV